jgi:hypothetical protein
VAVFALRAKSSLVEIRVTVGALPSRFGKYSTDVARITGYILVHPAQRVLSIVAMIELGFRA